MGNFKEKLEDVIKNTFSILQELQEKKSQTRLKFPKYSNGRIRVSEQELRFLFVEQVQSLLKEYDYYYSVETPTNQPYIFSLNGKKIRPIEDERGQSAAFDLTISDTSGKQIAIIEFKAKSADKHEIAKDFCKLFSANENGELRYFLNLFEKITPATEKHFRNKLKESNEYWPKNKSDMNVIVMAYSLHKEDKNIILTI